MASQPVSQPLESSLDPADWEQFRSLAHAALDEAIDMLRTVRDAPVWKAVPEEVRQALGEPLPEEGQGFAGAYRSFQELILPYPTGNIHPRFFGWVHGTGTASGVVAEMMAAAMNSNCGGRDHGALYVERSVVDWCKQLFGYGPESSGLLVSGTSMATLVAMTVARNAMAGCDIRKQGLYGAARRLTAYASAEAHESVAKALEMLGMGSGSLRRVPVDAELRMDLDALRAAVEADRAAGMQPFCVVGSAGTVNTGAIDDLAAMAAFCAREGIWFHVDGAFGALCVLSDELRPLLRGIEAADSIAFDFHKWMYVPYDAGCVLVKSAELHRSAFSLRPAYLASTDRGLAGGSPWFCEFGPELSRGFRALKVWFALKEFGKRRLGEMVYQNYGQARLLAQLVKQSPELELLLEPSLNIVCFRFAPRTNGDVDWDEFNRDLVADLQEQGIAAPSTTRVGGKLAIRVAITNHRSRREDFVILVNAVLDVGRRKLRG